jgi:hypothetical protein
MLVNVKFSQILGGVFIFLPSFDDLLAALRSPQADIGEGSISRLCSWRSLDLVLSNAWERIAGRSFGSQQHVSIYIGRDFRPVYCWYDSARKTDPEFVRKRGGVSNVERKDGG